MRILVTYAVQGEFTELKFPGLIGEEEVQVDLLQKLPLSCETY